MQRQRGVVVGAKKGGREGVRVRVKGRGRGRGSDFFFFCKKCVGEVEERGKKKREKKIGGW